MHWNYFICHTKCCIGSVIINNNLLYKINGLRTKTDDTYNINLQFLKILHKMIINKFS